MKLTNAELSEYIEMERAIVLNNEQSDNVNIVTVKILSALEELQELRREEYLAGVKTLTA